MPIDQPDLFVSNITVPAVVDWTDVFNLSFTIKNRGTAFASGYSLAAYRFDDAPVYRGNSGTTAYTDTLYPQESRTLTVMVDSLGLTPGTHTIWVAADMTGLIAESDETNNLASVTFTVGPAVAKPDLVVATGSVTVPPFVVVNGTLDFSYALENTGTGAAGNTTTYFRIDQQPTGGSFSTSQAAAGLDVGASATYNSSISVAGLSTGAHTLWLYTDGANTQAERSEANNWTSISFTVVNNRADLVVDTLLVENPILTEGDELDIIYSIMNIGPRTAPHSGWVWYRFDDQPSYAQHRELPMAGELAYGQFESQTASISTEGLSPGQHTLWVKVDGSDLIVGEVNEGNNYKSVTFTVTASPRPDQIIESITGPATIVQGSDVSFSYVLKDANSENTTNSFGAIIFGIDRQPTSSSYDYIVGAGTLPGGGSLTFNEVLHANLSVGQHTIWIKADGLGNVTEENEGNNLNSYTFTVTAAAPNPDLSLISIDGATSVEQGSSLNISYVIKNVGTLGAGVSNAGYMIDQEADATHYLSAPTISALAVNDLQSFNAIIDASSLSVGLHTVWFKADMFGTLTEISESNNWGSFTFNVTAAVRPDVVVSSITPAATSVVQGAKLVFSFLLENSGVAAAGSSWAGFRIDSQPDSTHADGFGLSSGLAADGTQTLSNSIDTSTLSVGTHTLYVMADYWSNLVGESNEANNVRSVTFEVTAPPRADLVVASVTPAATSVAQGAMLDFSFVLENLGNLPAGQSWAGFRIDSQPDQSNAAGFNLSGGLGTGGTQTLSNSIDTSALSVGTHTLYVMADYWSNLVGESNEANNVRSVTFEVTAPPRADLVVDSITMETSVVRGEMLDFSYVVKNIAAEMASGGNWAGIMIDQQPTAANFAGYDFVNGLAIDGAQTLNHSIDTSGLSVGTHTLYVMADYWSDLVVEGNEANNVRSVTFEVTAPPQADLQVASITPAATSIMKGAVLNFSYTVENDGTAGAVANWAGFMVDHQVDATHYQGFHQTNALSAGGTQTFTGTIDTSALEVGEHTLHVAADYWGNLVGESNEGNNGLFVTFNLTEAVLPDLAVSSVTAATTVVQGDALDFSYVIENISLGLPAGTSWAGFRIDQPPDQSNAAGFNHTNGLPSGGTQTLSNSIDTSSLSAGEHTLYVMADYWSNLVGESNEANNVRAFTFTVIDPFA